MVRDISSRTTGTDRIAVAVFNSIGHDTIRATTAIPLRGLWPSNRTVDGTSAAPGMAATKSIVGVRKRSTAGEWPIDTPTTPPMTTADRRPNANVPIVCSVAGAN